MKEIGATVANRLEFLKAEARPGITTSELDHMAGLFLAQYGAISVQKEHTCMVRKGKPYVFTNPTKRFSS